MKQHLGASGPETADVEALKQEVTELRQKVEQLSEENTDLKAKVGNVLYSILTYILAVVLCRNGTLMYNTSGVNSRGRCVCSHDWWYCCCPVVMWNITLTGAVLLAQRFSW